MFDLQAYLPFLIPLAIIQYGLTIAAIIHVCKAKTFRFGKRPLWIVLSLISIIGPVLYFTIGRADTD
ncbi:MAG: PLDc N-terminal domain-containing protein [Lachnospiraceae bacterium]|jgi:hypothetical protein|nr:PLDc N-terminal domain-containing protein [Lachnospiraceae bacterium]